MPRRRGQLVRTPIHLGAGRANPVTTLGPDLYTAIAGGFHPEEEPARLPPTHTVVTPSGQPATIRTPHATAPPVAGPGQTVITPTAQVGTVAPTSSVRTPQQIHQEKAQRLRQAALASLSPLQAPALPTLIPESAQVKSLNFDLAPYLSQEVHPDLGPLGAEGVTQAEGRRLLGQLPQGTPLSPHVVSSTSPVADRTLSYAAQLHPANEPGHTWGVSTAAVQRDPQDPLGKSTLGNETLGQLQKAAQAGTLRESAKGILSTPQNRAVLNRLVEAKQAVDQSGPNIAALHKAYPELSDQVLKSYADAARRTGVPPQLLAGIEEQESSYGQSTLPGVHGGQNSAGAAGPFQIGNGTGASGDAWEGIAKELWGNQADQHSIYNQHDAALAAGQYLAHTYGHATSDPSTWQAAAESYNHATWYGEKAVQVAEEHKKLAKLGLPPNPSATEALETAKRIAVQHGINPTPWNGDVEGGDSEYAYIRADAKGAVDWAKSTVGTQEGSPRQVKWAELEKLGPSEPWCSDWVSVNLARRGVELPANPNGSWEYENPGWKGGTQLGTDISKAKPGDLVVYGSGAHIAMYVGDGKVIAGNYGDEVAEYGATEDSRGISAIVRPNYKGGRVKVKAGTSLPGSSTESTFGGEGSGGEVTGGGAPGETQTVAATSGAGGTNAQIRGQEEALGLGVPAAPAFAAQIAQPTFQGEGESEQMWQALLAAASGSRA